MEKSKFVDPDPRPPDFKPDWRRCACCIFADKSEFFKIKIC